MSYQCSVTLKRK